MYNLYVQMIEMFSDSEVRGVEWNRISQGVASHLRMSDWGLRFIDSFSSFLFSNLLYSLHFFLLFLPSMTLPLPYPSPISFIPFLILSHSLFQPYRNLYTSHMCHFVYLLRVSTSSVCKKDPAQRTGQERCVEQGREG